MNTGSIRRSQSCAIDVRDAVREFHAGVTQPDMELVLFFCSNEYDRDVLAEEMNHLFPGIPVVGCTTAGEIGPAGCREHSIAGASSPTSEFTAVTGRIDDLQHFERSRGQAFGHAQLQTLQSRAPQSGPEHSFALLLIDGRSVREEPVTRALQNALGTLPLIGGSAGDGVIFGSTHVYCDGGFHADTGILILFTTPLPFRIFKIQHAVSTEERLIVTEVDSVHRVVTEINGLPAAEEYARVIGADAKDLDTSHFAASPVVVVIHDANYVRSIYKANPDGSLTFFCAIEEGLVLRVARGVDLLANMEQSFAAIEAEIGRPQFVFASDCVRRRMEILERALVDRVGEVFKHNRAVGFNTYGDQFRGVHVNRSLTGIAIGDDPAQAHNA
jgi:hypothetical protein